MFLYLQPADMRRSFDGLQALTRHAMGQDTLNGSLYAFVNRRCVPRRNLPPSGVIAAFFAPNEPAKLDEFFRRRDQRARLQCGENRVVRHSLCSPQNPNLPLDCDDNDAASRSGLVRHAEHATSEDGNHRRSKCTLDVWETVKRHARVSFLDHLSEYRLQFLCRPE